MTMHRKAILAATKLRLGLAFGVIYTIFFGYSVLGEPVQPFFDLVLTAVGIAAVVFVLSAITRIIHFVYEEW